MKKSFYKGLSTVIVVAGFFMAALPAHAAIYTWNQAGWNGGLDGGTYPVHPTNETGWTKYSAKDTLTTISGSAVTVSSTTGSVTQTTDTDFNAGTFASTSESGTSTAGSVVLGQPSQGSSDTWTSEANVPAATSNGTATVGANGLIYVIAGGGSTSFYEYSTSSNAWSGLASTPQTSAAGTVMYYPGSGNYIYAALGQGDENCYFYRYSISGNSWSQLACIGGEYFFTGDSLGGTGGNYIYAFTGSDNAAFFEYSISGNSWSQLTSLPAAGGAGRSITYPGSGNYLYVSQGNNTSGFYEYSISGNSWTGLTGSPTAFFNAGSIISPGEGDYIYAQAGSHTASVNTFMRYSISGNSWTTLSGMPFNPAEGSYLAYPGMGSFFYDAAAGGTQSFYKYQFAQAYYSSGTFTSSAIDLGQISTTTTFGFDIATSTIASTTIQFRIRSANTSAALSSATWYGPTSTSDYYTTTGQTINSATKIGRYFQYEAYINTPNILLSPTLQDTTISAIYYPATSTLTSSAYNSSSAQNALAKIQWTAATNASSSVEFQIRGAADASGTPGTWGSFVGPDGTSNTYFSSSTGGDSFPTDLATTSQWFQYKAYLVSADGTAAPASLSDVQINYVVNAPPQFNPNYPAASSSGVTATETASGTVSISYSVLDPDTNTGTVTPGYITPSFQYSTNGGATWTNILASTTNSGDTSNKAVSTSTYNTYTATWYPTEQIPNVYTTQAEIKVIANDNESANDIATASSTNFILDTTPPSVGGIPIMVDESQSPALVTLSATDNSALYMKIGTQSNLSGSSYVPYTATTTMSLNTGDTVYAQFEDAYGNATAIQSASPPETPSNIFYEDTSDPLTSEWRIFFAWGVVDNPTAGFMQYNVYRAVNGGAYSLLATSSNRTLNYIVDTNLNTDDSYSYKLTAEDLNGDISFYSASITHTPDGTGGTDLSVPVLSSVTVTNVTSTGATITWTTNKYSDSTVYYSATSTYPGGVTSSYATSTGVPSVVESHSVTLSGLTPSTQYYFMSQSTDPDSNIGVSADSSYTFTTTAGPVISNTTASTIYDTSAVITWNTDVPSGSTVYYSTSPTLADASSTGSGSLVTDHSVTINGLVYGTKYYYYVTSTDTDSNTAVDNDVVDGVVEYYSFNTTHDTSVPVISDVATSLVGLNGATITWTTDKAANSQVTYDTDPAFGTATSTSLTGDYVIDHSVTLSGLASSTTYYYSVYSADSNGDSAVSTSSSGTQYSFITASPGTTTIQTVYGGGGGGGSYQNTTPPTISGISVTQTGQNSATVTFTTSEIANGVVNYGPDSSYGDQAGDPTVYGLNHSVALTDLAALTTYHFSVTSSDVNNNTASSPDATFTLADFNSPNADTDLYDSGTSTSSSNSSASGNSVLTADQQALLDQVKDVPEAMVSDIINALADNQNLLNIPQDQFAAAINSLTSKIISAPVISGSNISVNPGSDSVEITWTTDKDSNSMVSYADSAAYSPNSADPYTITAGNPNDDVTDHQVVLPNLNPDTTYHFEVSSKGSLGPTASSQDGTFKTTSALPQVFNTTFTDIGEDSATLNWNTDVPAKTKITLKNTQTGVSSSTVESSYETDHTYSFGSLAFSTPYTITLVATDASGTVSDPLVVPFSTVISKSAPVISNVRVTTSLIPGNVETAQTIVSWTTDKPSTSQIFFGQGSASDLTQSTPLDPGLTTSHVVITTLLSPGTVYKIKAESTDSSGNITDSSPYTVLTPAPAGSIVDLIISNLQSTFGVFAK